MVEETQLKSSPERETEDTVSGGGSTGVKRAAKAALVLLLLGVLAAGGYRGWLYLQSYESTDDAQIDGPMTTIGPRVAGTVIAVHVSENQSVVPGQTLVELDPRDFAVAVDQAKAMLAQAEAQALTGNPNVQITSTTMATGIATTETDVTNAEAAVAASERDHQADLARLREAESDSAKAQADLARYKMLVAKEEVSREEYDQRAAAAQATAAAVDRYRATAASSQKEIQQRQGAVEQARVRLEQARKNAPLEVAIQRAGLNSRVAGALAARAALEQARLNLEYTKIAAPMGGIVGRKSVEVGMRVQPGQQLMALVPVEDVWVTANFKETQLRYMRPGQKARIHVDTFGRDYDGYVESLPAATGARYSLLPPENATGNYVKVVQRLPVRIRFAPGQDPEHRLRPGMSVEPKVWLHKR